jgi:hypothetical protein
MTIFLELFSERFYLLLKFLHFADNVSYDEATCGSKRLYKLKPILNHLNAKFRSLYTPECDVSRLVFDDLEGTFVMEGIHSFKTCQI